MKNTIILSLTLMSGFLLACGIKEIEHNENKNPAWLTPLPEETTICVTGVEYPKDYNWQNDAEYGSIKCSLIVESEGKIITRIPVGHEYEISSDPDMHRFIANALYTDYSSSTHTIIKRNGEELFRYEGREMLVKMEVFGDEVHTIGKSRSGAGFTYRIDGKTLLEGDGEIFPYITTDGDTFTFCYTKSKGDGTTGYYCYNKGQHHEFSPHKAMTKVHDAAYHNGKVVYLGPMVGGLALVIVKGLESELLQFSGFGNISDIRIIDLRNDNVYFSLCWSSRYTKQKIVYIFENALKLRRWAIDDAITYSFLSFNRICGLLPASMKVFEGDEDYELPKEYRLLAHPPIFICEDEIYVALSSRENKYPILWTKDGVREVKINGFLSSVSIIKKNYKEESSQENVQE